MSCNKTALAVLNGIISSRDVRIELELHYLVSFSFQLELLREMKLSWQECADALLVSRSTLWRRLKEMKVMPTFSDITDSELDAVVEAIQHNSPRSGAVLVWGELKSHGISVSRRRVRESLVRVNPTGVELRASTCVVRRAYSVPCSNALWHIDGLHCLIRWRIVIHGGIDGYSRQVVYLGASDNNKSETVLSLFLEATRAYCWPSPVVEGRTLRWQDA